LGWEGELMNEAGFIAAFIAASLAMSLTGYLARQGTENAINDLRNEDNWEPGELAARQTRQDVAAILSVLPITNALLAAIAGALLFR